MAYLTILTCLAGCTGSITGGGGPGGAVGDDDDQPPPGSADAGVPPVEGQPDAAPPPVANTLAAGIRIQDVAIYQTVGVPLAHGGSAVSTRNAPVVEGRDSMFAIAFAVEAGFVARPIEARVTVDGVPYAAQQTISASSGDVPTAQLRLKVPGAAIKAASVFEVALHEVAGAPTQPGSTEGARYPATGSAPLGAVSVNGPLHLVLVPFRYNADGSGRLPPLDDASIAAHRSAFKAMYPVADVEVSVHAPVDTSITIQSSSSWGQWLDELAGVRQADAPAANVYYYGLAAPATSFGGFCNGGCIVGLGNVPSANNPFLFASVGVSFPGNLLSDTALHEVGHTMGRQHVDCGGPAGIDPNFPYPGGSIGVWGYDAVKDKLKDPSVFTDIMGYCNSQWMSDYETKAIFERIANVNDGATPLIIGPPQTYRVGLVDAAGNIEWRRFATLALPPDGGSARVSLRDRSGAELGSASGHYFPYDHMPGGTLYVPVGGMLDTAAVAPAGFTLAR